MKIFLPVFSKTALAGRTIDLITCRLNCLQLFKSVRRKFSAFFSCKKKISSILKPDVKNLNPQWKTWPENRTSRIKYEEVLHFRKDYWAKPSMTFERVSKHLARRQITIKFHHHIFRMFVGTRTAHVDSKHRNDPFDVEIVDEKRFTA